jgi:hypothetical protein
MVPFGGGQHVADRGGEDVERAGWVDPAGADFVAAGVHEGEGGGDEPVGGEVGAECALVAAALDELADPVVGGFVGAGERRGAELLGGGLRDGAIVLELARVDRRSAHLASGSIARTQSWSSVTSAGRPQQQRSVSARTPARAGEACATSCCSASRRSRSGGTPPDAQARRSRAARGAPHVLRRHARVSRAARPLRLRRSRGGRRGGSRVLGAARPPRGRRRRRRVRPGAGAAGRREGR